MEERYNNLFDKFLTKKLTADQFADNFMDLWREDRDNVIRSKSDALDPRFRRIVDRIFTSCDCLNDTSDKFTISEDDLRQEVDLLRHIWFG